MGNTRSYKHTITQELLDANPQLVEAGYKDGDHVKITVSTKAAGLSAEDAAKELIAQLLANVDKKVSATTENESEADDEETDDAQHPAMQALQQYFEGNAAGSTDRNKSIDASAQWLKSDVMGTVRHMGGGTITKQLFTSFATEMCKGIDQVAEKLKEKE